MNNTDRPNRNSSDLSDLSRLSDRNFHQQQKKKGTSKVHPSNEEVLSMESEKKSNQDGSNKRRKSIMANIMHYIVPQNFLEKDKCRICEELHAVTILKQFGPCGHSFCQGCLKQHVELKLKNMELIVCPLQDCRKELQKGTSMYEKLLTEQDRATYVKIHRQILILSNPDLKSCKNQHCHGILNIKNFKLQLSGNPNAIIKCLQCNIQYCPGCYEEKHEGECEKSIVKFLQRNKKFRQCSQCKRVIQKSQGCTHMTCLCGFYFCYMCGQQLQTGIHQCKVPQSLNCLQLVRWDIQHKELFYESNLLSFHRYLYCFDLSAEKPLIVRILGSLMYTITIYPLSIVLGLLLILMFFVFLFIILTLLFFFLPLSELCTSGRDYCFTQTIQNSCGYFGLVMLMLVFYPVFVVAIMVEAINQVCGDEETPEEILIAFKEIGLGLRNLLFMPIVLCVHPSTIDVQQNPQTKLNT